MEAMEFLSSPEPEPGPSQSIFQTVRVETDTLPPLVELGRKLLTKAQDGDVEGVKTLMKQGAPFTTDWLGTSPLHWACSENHLDVAEVLLKAGITRDSRNKVDRTPLHVTAQEGHEEILKLLLSYGVDVDAIDMLRMTPLHWAAEYGHMECVRLLLENGADPLAINKFDKTPDQIAFDNNRMDITHMIQEYAESPLRQERRKQAKEKRKQSLAAHKAVMELEKLNQKAPKVNLNGDTTLPNVVLNGDTTLPKVTFNGGTTLPEMKDVRVVKLRQMKGPPTQTTPPKVIFDNPHKLVFENLSFTSPATTNMAANSVQLTNDNNTEKTLAMLQAHGISLLPPDDSTIVASAVQNGQKVLLTEAGKMALNLTETPVTLKPPTLGVKRLIKLPPDLLRGRKMIKITPQDLVKMKKERRVVIHAASTDKRAMILTKPGVIPITHKKVVFKTKSMVAEEEETKRVDRGEEDSVLQRIKQELEETKKQVQELREQYLMKEKEAQDYKRIIDLLRNS